MSGAIAELARYVLAQDFRSVDPRKNQSCPPRRWTTHPSELPEDLAQNAVEQLGELGVEVMTHSRVVAITDSGVELEGDNHDEMPGLGSGREREHIAADTVLWAAGVRANALADCIDVPRDRQGRLIVQDDCSLPGHPEVFAIGDIARFEEEGRCFPASAPSRCSKAATSPRSSVGKPRATGGRHGRRFTTSTRARWRRSVAHARSLGPGPEDDRLHRLARVALHPRLLPDRVQEPPDGRHQLVLVVRLVQTWSAPDHGDRLGAHVVEKARMCGSGIDAEDRRPDGSCSGKAHARTGAAELIRRKLSSPGRRRAPRTRAARGCRTHPAPIAEDPRCVGSRCSRRLGGMPPRLGVEHHDRLGIEALRHLNARVVPALPPSRFEATKRGVPHHAIGVAREEFCVRSASSIAKTGLASCGNGWRIS